MNILFTFKIKIWQNLLGIYFEANLCIFPWHALVYTSAGDRGILLFVRTAAFPKGKQNGVFSFILYFTDRKVAINLKGSSTILCLRIFIIVLHFVYDRLGYKAHSRQMLDLI